MSSGTFKITKNGTKAPIIITSDYDKLPLHEKSALLWIIESWIKKERVNINNKIAKA